MSLKIVAFQQAGQFIYIVKSGVSSAQVRGIKKRLLSCTGAGHSCPRELRCMNVECVCVCECVC